MGNKVDLYVNGSYYGTIIDDPQITIGTVYPVITFGAADGDKIGLLPVAKEAPPHKSGSTKPSTAKATIQQQSRPIEAL